MRISDRVVGPVLLLFGVVVIWGALQLPTIPGVRFGADLMPSLIGFCLIGLGLSIAIGGFTSKDQIKLLDVSEWSVPLRNKLAAIWSLGGLIIGGLFFEVIGFPLLGVIYMAVLMTLMGTRFRTTAAVSILVVAVLYIGFSKGLLVPLPAGLLGGILP
nr:tripartite tricarboxylate transporter TctB family protein [uncultured Cohaesibacter sp.]